MYPLAFAGVSSSNATGNSFPVPPQWNNNDNILESPDSNVVLEGAQMPYSKTTEPQWGFQLVVIKWQNQNYGP